MSTFTAPSFQIYSDGPENQHAGLRKTKRDEASGKPPATKRAALGVITNNTRVQPLRAVKQVSLWMGAMVWIPNNAFIFWEPLKLMKIIATCYPITCTKRYMLVLYNRVIPLKVLAGLMLKMYNQNKERPLGLKFNHSPSMLMGKFPNFNQLLFNNQDQPLSFSLDQTNFHCTLASQDWGL